MLHHVITDLGQLDDLLAVADAQTNARRLPAITHQALEVEARISQHLMYAQAAMRAALGEDKTSIVDRYFRMITSDLHGLVTLTSQAANAAGANADLAAKLKGQRDKLARDLTALTAAMESADDSHPAVANLMELLEENEPDYQTRLEDILGNDDAAETLADLVLGRKEIDADALGGVITALIGMWETKTGQTVTVNVHPALEAKSA